MTVVVASLLQENQQVNEIEHDSHYYTQLFKKIRFQKDLINVIHK